MDTVKTQPRDRSINAVLQSIQQDDDSATLVSHIEKLSPNALQSWHDDSDNDLLHHAILSNNVVAAAQIAQL